MPAILGQAGNALLPIGSSSPFDDPSLQMHRIIKQRDRSMNNTSDHGQPVGGASSLNSTANMQNSINGK